MVQFFGRSIAFFFSFIALQTAMAQPPQYIITDPKLLQATDIPPLKSAPEVNVALARVTPQQLQRLTEKAHDWGRCGGFEALGTGDSSLEWTNTVASLKSQLNKNLTYLARPRNIRFSSFNKRPEIVQAIQQVSESNLRESVEWMSRFPNRLHSGKNANDHIAPLKNKLQQFVQGSSLPVSIDEISHQSTGQKSVRLRIEGSTRPNEIIVLGGHADSTGGWFSSGKAPGADDNASGSANLIETVRILLSQSRPERSIEFFWYGGEEGGLLGSAEIAKDYKSKGKDVVAVVQLDMTLFPGSGPFVLGSMTDFTSAWLRDVLTQINSLYINARIIEDQCGYGCSDHASWHKNGFPTLMPFESNKSNMNSNIHSEYDVIDSRSNFAHSAMFTKIALAIAMELGNSVARAP